MELTVDRKQIEAIVAEQVSRAVNSAFTGYDAQQQIGKVVTDALAQSSLMDAIESAVHGIDGTKLTEQLAGEIQRATTRAVIALIRDSMVQVVARVRGMSEYGVDAEKARDRLRAELFGGRA